MSCKVEVKDLAPMLVIVNKEECPVSSMEKVAKNLFDAARDVFRCNDAICLCDQLEHSKDTKVQVCLPILERTPFIDDQTMDYKVLRRMKVASIVNKDSDEDMSIVFETLHAYLAEHEIEPIMPCRIIYNKAGGGPIGKRSIFKKQNEKYTVEIQVPIELPY